MEENIRDFQRRVCKIAYEWEYKIHSPFSFTLFTIIGEMDFVGNLHFGSYYADTCFTLAYADGVRSALVSVPLHIYVTMH